MQPSVNFLIPTYLDVNEAMPRPHEIGAPNSLLQESVMPGQGILISSALDTIAAGICDPNVPPGAGRPLRLHLLEEEARPGHAQVREEHHGVRPLQACRLPDWPVHQGRTQP